MSCAICFNLDKYKILSSGTGLKCHWLQLTFFLVILCYSLLMHVRKVPNGFRKKSFASADVRKPGKLRCATDRRVTNLAVKMVSNLDTNKKFLKMAYNHFPNKPWFLLVCNTRLLKALFLLFPLCFLPFW